jgi:hypothetical protein
VGQIVRSSSLKFEPLPHPLPLANVQSFEDEVGMKALKL